MQTETEVMDKTKPAEGKRKNSSATGAATNGEKKIKATASATNRMAGKPTAAAPVTQTNDTTKAPNMDKPILGKAERGAAPTATAKTDRTVGSRSRELSSLIGRTNRLELRKKHIVKSVAFISNKGGVGKTHVSTNMSFYLSRLNKNALLIDLDLGNSDVTNKLGFYCDNTIIDLLRGKREVSQLIYTCDHGFDLIAGESGNFKLANMTSLQKTRFIKAFKEIGNDYDYVLYDLSAGIGSTTMDFALAQDYQVIITTPQDIVAGYSCVKAAFHRFKELEMSMSERDRDYEPRRVFRPMIVFNQVPDFKSGRALFERMQQVIEQNLSNDPEFKIQVNFLGAVIADPSHIREAELNRFLYSSKYGASHSGQCFNFLVHNLAQYRDPNQINFTNKLRRFVDIFMRSVGETKYAQ